MSCFMPTRYLTSRYMQAVGTFLFANHFYSFALKFYKNCEREVTLDVTIYVYNVNIYLEH